MGLDGDAVHLPFFSRVADVNLTVADGFKLGCGVILAASFAFVILVLVLSLAIFVSTLLGRPVPFPLTP
jgi:hypothetical protein